jgi:hypothetical protein
LLKLVKSGHVQSRKVSTFLDFERIGKILRELLRVLMLFIKSVFVIEGQKITDRIQA